MKKHSRKLIIVAVGVLIAATAWLWQEYKPGPRYLGRCHRRDAVWSHDGKALFYVLNNKRSKLYRYDTTNGRRKVHRTPGIRDDIIISPDQKEIIIMGDSPEVTAYNLDTGKSRVLFSLKENHGVIGWLPHNFFLFEQWINTEKTVIYMARPDGSDKTVLADAYFRYLANTNDLFYFVNRKGKNVIQFYRFDFVKKQRSFITEQPFHSPTGAPISPVYASDRQIIYTYGRIVQSIELDTLKIRRINNMPRPHNFGISISNDLGSYYFRRNMGTHWPDKLYIGRMPKLEYSKPLP